MSNEDINNQLNREADNWLEREKARIYHAVKAKERQDRRQAHAALIIGSGVVLLVLAGALYLAAVAR